MRIIEVTTRRNVTRTGASKGEGSRFVVPHGWLGSKPEGIVEITRRPDEVVLIKMARKPSDPQEDRGIIQLREAVQSLQRLKPTSDLDEVSDAGTS